MLIFWVQCDRLVCVLNSGREQVAVDRALKAEFDRHLAKPILPNVLVEAIVSLTKQALTN